MSASMPATRIVYQPAFEAWVAGKDLAAEEVLLGGAPTTVYRDRAGNICATHVRAGRWTGLYHLHREPAA